MLDSEVNEEEKKDWMLARLWKWESAGCDGQKGNCYENPEKGAIKFFVTFSYNIIANFSIISISGPKEELVSKATSWWRCLWSKWSGRGSCKQWAVNMILEFHPSFINTSGTNATKRCWCGGLWILTDCCLRVEVGICSAMDQLWRPEWCHHSLKSNFSPTDHHPEKARCHRWKNLNSQILQDNHFVWTTMIPDFYVMKIKGKSFVWFTLRPS